MNRILIQVLTAGVLSIPFMMVGFSIAWSSYTLTTLQTDNSPLGYKITQGDGDLIGSLPMLGCLVATLVGGPVGDLIGRKRAGILCGLIFALSWAIIATAKNVMQIFVGRFLTGFASGAYNVVGFVLMGEVAQESIRGSLMSFFAFAYTSGGLFSYLMGWFCSYDFINYLNLSLSVLFVILMSLIKETPSYLLRKGNEKGALKSLKFYRGANDTTPEILEEIKSIKNILGNQDEEDKSDGEKVTKEECEKLNPDAEMQQKKKQPTWKLFLTSKAAQRALVITSTQIILVVCMGTIGVQAYAGQLFRRAAPNLSSDLCSVMLALAVAVGSAVSMAVTDVIGRRVLAIASATSACICLILLGALLRWPFGPEWAIPLVVLLFSGTFQMGIGNIPFIQLAESFVPQLKSLATTVAMCNMWIANFIVLAVFGPMVSNLGLSGTFFVFAATSSATVAFIFLFMKETRGAPLEKVLEMYEEGYLYRKKKDIK